MYLKNNNPKKKKKKKIFGIFWICIFFETREFRDAEQDDENPRKDTSGNCGGWTRIE